MSRPRAILDFRPPLFTKDATRVLDLHLVRDAGFGQAHKLGKRRMGGTTAGRQRDPARDRGLAVAVERAQVNAPRGAAGGAIDP
jgi:hypothetical protein